MKKLHLSFILIILGIVNAHSQMNRMLIGDKIFNPQTNGLEEMPQTFKSDYSQNALFFNDGKLAIYATDGKIYDWNGNLITSFIFNSEYCDPSGVNVPGQSRGTGYSEFVFVKAPFGCNEFYAIAVCSRKSYAKNNEKSYGAIIYQKLKYNGIGWEVIPSANGCNQPTVITLMDCEYLQTECGTHIKFNSDAKGNPGNDFRSKKGLREGESGNVEEGDPNTPLQDELEHSAYLEVTKEQSNGFRYLFTALDGCLNLFEIKNDDIYFKSNITNQINSFNITSTCDNDWYNMNFDQTVNPTPTIQLDINNYFKSRIGGFRGEMDIIQISNESIRLAIPYLSYTNFWDNVPGGFNVVKTISVTGVDVIYFNLINGVPTFQREELLGIDYPSNTAVTNIQHKRRIIKGIEFSDNGSYLYVSSILLNFNSDQKGSLAKIMPSNILDAYSYDVNSNCYSNFLTNGGQNLMNTFNSTLPFDYQDIRSQNATCDILRDGSFSISQDNQYGFGQIERDNSNRLIISNEKKLMALSDINNPLSPLSVITLPQTPIFQNTISTHRKHKINRLSISKAQLPPNNSDPFVITPLTYLLPDQITGENYANWFSPIIDLYPETVIIFPNTTFPWDYTNSPHTIDLFKGTISNSAPTFYNKLYFDVPITPPANVFGDYFKWTTNPDYTLDAPITKAIATYTQNAGIYCAGKEEIKILDLRHKVYSAFNYDLQSMTGGPTTPWSNGNYTILNWILDEGVYPLPIEFKNCVRQEINIYEVDPITQSRLSTASLNILNSFATNYIIPLYTSGSYEAEYKVCFDNCTAANGSGVIPNCNITSKFFNIP